jgi:hypothetical protein
MSYQLDTSEEEAVLWKEMKVVIEMKTRTQRIQRPPPLYEQIQLVSYMVMLGCEHGDLVQAIPNNDVAPKDESVNFAQKVMQREKVSNVEDSVITADARDIASAEITILDITTTLQPECNINKNSTVTVLGQIPQQQTYLSAFHVHRVHLHGAPYHHSHHWEETILPRLHVFKDAILAVRKDDELRYAFLLATEEERKQLVAYLCPYFG